jgi:RNA-directed DNA polymerase
MSYPASAKSAGHCTDNNICKPTLNSIAQEIALWSGYRAAVKGKQNRRPVLNYEKNVGSNIQKTSKLLLCQKYVPVLPRSFMITEPKLRRIDSPAIRDSVIQHSIYQAVYPMFDRGFIHDNYGCRLGKGTHKAADAVQRYFRQCDGDEYYLQLDIRKFYYSIDHDILRQRLERKIDDKPLVDLMMSFAGSYPTGLYIGNLLSQLFGLIYLDFMDHFIKRVLKIKRYVRYVDDFVLIGMTLEEAQQHKDTIELWIKGNLKLEFSKWRIAKVKHGINYCGFRTWRKSRFVRKRALHNFSKALKREKVDSIQSLLAHSKKTGSHAHFVKRINKEKPQLKELISGNLLSTTY